MKWFISQRHKNKTVNINLNVARKHKKGVWRLFKNYVTLWIPAQKHKQAQKSLPPRSPPIQLIPPRFRKRHPFSSLRRTVIVFRRLQVGWRHGALFQLLLRKSSPPISRATLQLVLLSVKRETARSDWSADFADAFNCRTGALHSGCDI